jgi:hypothetical protein
MKLFCANCGLQLRTIRKAVPKYGTILDLVEPHTCLETPVDPTTVLIEAPISTEDRNKFVESLNGLKPPASPLGSIDRAPRRPSMTGTDDLRDRRFDGKVPSIAPSSVLDQIKSMSNSIPAHDIKDATTDSEMGG